MRVCKCGSYAVNVDPEGIFCDVCYWKNKYEEKSQAIDNLVNILSKFDCGSSSCIFAKDKTGQRTNSGCSCLMNRTPTLIRIELEKIFYYNKK